MMCKTYEQVGNDSKSVFIPDIAKFPLCDGAWCLSRFEAYLLFWGGWFPIHKAGIK